MKMLSCNKIKPYKTNLLMSKNVQHNIDNIFICPFRIQKAFKEYIYNLSFYKRQEKIALFHNKLIVKITLLKTDLNKSHCNNSDV